MLLWCSALCSLGAYSHLAPYTGNPTFHEGNRGLPRSSTIGLALKLVANKGICTLLPWPKQRMKLQTRFESHVPEFESHSHIRWGSPQLQSSRGCICGLQCTGKISLETTSACATYVKASGEFVVPLSGLRSQATDHSFIIIPKPISLAWDWQNHFYFLPASPS